jgi:hypothetical protein
MKTWFLVSLTFFNAVILSVSLLQHVSPAVASDAGNKLRGSGLEIVDARGRVRASLEVLPAGRSQDGTPYNETVLLRLITEQGRPSVKIGASEETAGLSFAGPTGTKGTYVILESKGKLSSLKLRNEDGREQLLEPK